MKVDLIDHMGSDLTVVNAARVSFNKHKDMVDASDGRLIQYLGSHGHISPFGHCFASFRCSAPVFVCRQLVKHKFLRWNEISRRYVSTEPDLYFPNEWRDQAPDKKQGSGGASIMTHIADVAARHACNKALEQYELMLDIGICEEQARMILPQNMITEWYWSGSLDAFADMCNLRCKKDTQYETQQIAYAIDECMSSLYPLSWDALRS